MNETDIAYFKGLIAARLSDLEGDTARGQEGQRVVELDQQAVGRLSRMDALQNQAMARAGQARRDVEVKRLTAALKRMEEGEFGFCEDCGEEIGRGRLELDPAATRCISCAAS